MSLRQALTNSDIHASSLKQNYTTYTRFSSQPTSLPKLPQPQMLHKSINFLISPSSFSSNTSSRRAPISGARPPASQGRAPDSADARPGEDPAAAQPSAAAFSSAIPKPTSTSSSGSAAHPSQLRARSPSKRLAAMAGLHSPAACPFRLRAHSPSKCSQVAS